MYYQRLFLLAAIFSFSCLFVVAQKSLSAKNDFAFSAIKGTASKPDSIVVPKSATLSFTGGDRESFKLQVKEGGKILMVFMPAADFVGTVRAKFDVKNAAGKTIAHVHLTGLSTNAWEGENEAPLANIIDALGFKANIGWTSLANHTRPEQVGDEILTGLFKKAGDAKVEIIPVARYSPDFELPFGFYINTNEGAEKHQVGVLATKGEFPEHQTLYPALSSGRRSFDPGNKVFGFFTTGNTHTAYSEDAWNILYHPTHAIHATRVYAVKDREDKAIKNTYLLCVEEAANGDYNDYVFLVKNIVPVTANLFTNLFDGKDLNGWDTFLSNIGKNADPSGNFRIEDGTMHVMGKDLGYAITKGNFNNFHFKVDFKWGEKKWPPRENAKRDAGICYNIPVNEPDSIWPRSIECQIQEGDTGDFWLLGFTTITVDGQQNKPMNHAQIVKKRDAEKPSGEWNTVEVISYNGKCVHVVNGVVVNVGEGASVKSGRILLQSEYSEIYYRNIKIREL